MPSQQFFVFGDSLSDTGNIYELSNHVLPISPPFFKGRYSNGPLWIETVAAHFGDTVNPSQQNGTNFAFAGARTGADVHKLGKTIPSLLSQLVFFQQVHPLADPAACYVVWGGTNDYYAVDGMNQPTPQDAREAANAAVQNLVQVISGLAAVGARRFLLVNLPDLSRAPGIQHPKLAALFTTTFNLALMAEQAALNVAGKVNISLLDLFSLFMQILANPQYFGLQNVNSQCLDGDDLNGGTPCSQPDAYWFWYAVHPTGAGHRIIGQAALQLMRP